MTCTIRSTALATLLTLGSGLALAQDAPAGGPPMMPSGPRSKAAIYIEDGAETGAREYTAGQYTARIKSGATGVVIEGASISSGDYSFTGVVATGEKSVVTLNHVTMKLGVTKEAGTKDLAGATLRGRVEVDGRPVMPVAGETYTGRITVTPL